MKNLIESDIRIRFDNVKDKNFFKKSLLKNKLNLCNMAMPITLFKPNMKKFKKGQKWGEITLLNGKKEILTELPVNIEHWGTPWEIFDTKVSYKLFKVVNLHFATAYTPISEDCIQALINKYNIKELFYSFIEPENGYIGHIKFNEGKLTSKYKK